MGIVILIVLVAIAFAAALYIPAVREKAKAAEDAALTAEHNAAQQVSNWTEAAKDIAEKL